MTRASWILAMLVGGLCARAAEPQRTEQLPQVDSPPGPAPASGRQRTSAECVDKEPGVGEVVRAAWSEAGLLVAEDRSRKTRVRISGWLPKVSGGVSMDTGDKRDYRYEPGTPRVDQLHQDEGLGWDAGLSWDLSEMVFRSEELQVAREASRRARERLDLAAEIIRLYFARRRLMLQDPNAPGPLLQIAEATATLNVWTGNRFRKRWCPDSRMEGPGP